MRSGTPFVSASLAFARVLISAMWTPCGQTWVQMPQLEQKSTDASGETSSPLRKRSACGPTYFGPGTAA